MDWKIARESVQTVSGLQMVNVTARKPDQNVKKIMGDGLKVLGLDPLDPFYKVSTIFVAITK